MRFVVSRVLNIENVAGHCTRSRPRVTVVPRIENGNSG